MRATFGAAGVFASLAASASAQVPVADVAREAKETQTAGCAVRAAVARGATLPPAQGVRTSLASPTPAAPSAQVGATGVSGLPAGAPATSTGFGFLSGNTVAGVDFGNLTASPTGGTSSVAPALGLPSVATLGQIVNGLSGLTSALQANGAQLQAAGAAVGGLNAAQAAWSQNTSARIGGASIWGQAIQVGGLALQLRNLKLLQQAARASGQSQVMRYDAGAALLVGGRAPIAGNSVVNVFSSPTSSAIAAALSAAQKAAAANVSPTASP